MKMLGTIILATLFIACSSSSRLQNNTVNYVDDSNFFDILYDPVAHYGEEVIWGGEIVNVSQIPEGSEITLNQLPLNSSGEPQEVKYSLGKFLARSEISLDKAIFQNQKKIIIIGKVIGSYTKPFGDKTYSYPLISIKEVYFYDEATSADLFQCHQMPGWLGPYKRDCK